MSLTLSRIMTGLKYSSILTKSMVIKSWNKEASRRYLIDSLSSMSGLSAKAAQFLTMKLSPGDEHSNPRLEAIPIEWVKAWIASQSPQLHQDIDELSADPWVASFGQVHVARLHSGELLAIKVQYPNMLESFEEQLGMLRSVSKLGPPKQFHFEMDSIFDYFETSLRRELDYQQEARQQNQARMGLAENSSVCIPKVYDRYTQRTILVQSFEPSSSLQEIQKEWSLDARRMAAQILVKYFLNAVFSSRFLHTDLHPGNLGFRGYPGQPVELVLYDFGSVMTIERPLATLLWQMITGFAAHKDFVPFDYLVALGFDAHKLLPVAGRLACLLERLFEPFSHPGAIDFRDWDVKDHFEKVLGDDRWWFRSAGPPWFLMLMRAYQGLIHALRELHCEVSLQKCLFDLNLSMPEIEIPTVLKELGQTQSGHTGAMARSLRVMVKDLDGHIVVDLSLPRRSVDELEELIPEETLVQVKQQNIDIAAIKSRVQLSGYLPQQLFQLQNERRHYRIWLE